MFLEAKMGIAVLNMSHPVRIMDNANQWQILIDYPELRIGREVTQTQQNCKSEQRLAPLMQ